MNYRVTILGIAILCLFVSSTAFGTIFNVTNTDDSGTGSLRQAIIDAAANPGNDEIQFTIPGSGPHSITVTSNLPDISQPVAIDGANNGLASDIVEIRGAGAVNSGLIFSTVSNCALTRMVINGCTSRQILIINASQIQVIGCYLGVNASGTAIVDGSGIGIESVNSSDVFIGAENVASRNVISSVNNNGITIGGGNAFIRGNYIGINAAGTSTLGTPNTGIAVANASATIGGNTTLPSNVIVAHTGIDFGGNPALGHSSGTVRSNFIGTDASGTKALNLGNGAGVQVSHGTGVIIDTGNVISGNGDGIVVSSSGISGASSDSTVIEGNFIGTQADGISPLGNSGRGVYIFGSPNNHVGNINGGGRNVIAFNGAAGIVIGANTGNAVQENSIFANGGLGIDLDTTGVNLNDVGDPDTGGNNLQNYPRITSVTIESGENALIAGSLNSTANTTFRLEFFGSTKANSSGFGEGEVFLGSFDVTTDEMGNTSFGTVFGAPNVRVFTATATDPNGNTSEFSPAFLTRLLNISTRMKVLTEQKVLIGGFIVTGAGPKRVIVRGLGPSLGAQGVPGALADPTLELHGNSITITNDNWRDTQQAEIEATGIPPTDTLESAIVASLDPGPYTAILGGKNATTGVGLVEVYDLDQSAGSKLANISTRGFVDTEANVMIGGFIAGPDLGDASVLLRGIGSSLVGSGIQDALMDPVMELHDGSGTTIAMNDNWRDTQQAEIEATGIAPTDDHESAILQTLSPGSYTAIVRGNNNTVGVGLVEAYNLQ